MSKRYEGRLEGEGRRRYQLVTPRAFPTIRAGEDLWANKVVQRLCDSVDMIDVQRDAPELP